MMAVLALVKGRRASNVLSETARAGYAALDLALPEKPVQEAASPTGATQCQIVYDAARVSIGLPELLRLIEAERCISARNVFEIGTSSGGTTWHLAANISPGGRVHTLDLPPEIDRKGDCSPARLATERPSAARLGSLFAGTPEEQTITRHLCDSRKFVDEELQGQMDLVFIDGGHTRSLVENDTALATRLLREGGIMAWHDYFVFHPRYGVRNYLHYLTRRGIPIYRFPGTLAAFCVYRKESWARVQKHGAKESW